MSCETCISRRQFISTAAGVSVGALAVGVVSSLSLVSCAGSGASGGGGGSTPIPSGTYDFSFADNPTLGNSNGGAISTTIMGTAVKIVRFNNNIYCVTANCTHQGTIVNDFSGTEGTGEFVCSNHGSRFSITGAVTNGPAAAALTRYTAALVPDTVSPTGVRVTVS